MPYCCLLYLDGQSADKELAMMFSFFAAISLIDSSMKESILRFPSPCLK